MADYQSAYTGQEIDSGIAKANTAIQSSDLSTVATSGSYNDLSNKPDEVTETTVSNWGFTKNTGTYSKPSGGIPKTDLTNDVQTSLGKADTAIQSSDLTNYVTNTDYATSSTGGVIKVSNGDYGMTVDSGVLKGTVRTYAQYNDMSSKGLVAKGTLENVITGKGLGTYSKPSGGIPKTDLASDIVETLNKADSIKTELEDSDNHFDVSAITFGYEVHSTDGISPESNSAISDYIPVTQGTVVYINNSPTYTSAVGKVKRIAEFNENKEFILQTNRIGVDESQYAYTVQNANTKYLVFGVYQRVTDNTVRENLDYSHIMVTFNVGYKPYKEYVKPGMTVNLEKPTKDKKMLIFGDSITETASMNDDGTNYVEGVRTNWMTFAKDMLETSNFKNYAQSGAMYKDFSGKEYYRQWVSNQIGIAISDSNNDDAEIIVLSLGTNDGSANDTYESAMLVANRTDLDRTKFYEAIRYAMWTLKDKYPDAKCFVATPIQRAAREQDVSLRTAIIKMGNRYNFKIIDAEFESGIIRDNEVYQGEGEDLYDGLHPNGKGAQKMAELYSSVILNSYLFE